MTRTTPELLRAAATRLREVTEGTHLVDKQWRFAADDYCDGGEVTAAGGYHVANVGLDPNGTFIATMDPTVATALADLLDAEAKCIDLEMCSHGHRYTRALARAILKETK